MPECRLVSRPISHNWTPRPRRLPNQLNNGLFVKVADPLFQPVRITVLDVRSRRSGATVTSSTPFHIPGGELPKRVNELPSDNNYT